MDVELLAQIDLGQSADIVERLGIGGTLVLIALVIAVGGIGIGLLVARGQTQRIKAEAEAVKGENDTRLLVNQTMERFAQQNERQHEQYLDLQKRFHEVENKYTELSARFEERQKAHDEIIQRWKEKDEATTALMRLEQGRTREALDELKVAKRDRDTLTTELGRLNTEINLIKADRIADQHTIAELREENGKLTRLNTELETEQKTNRSEIENLKLMVEELKHKVAALEHENAELKTKPIPNGKLESQPEQMEVLPA